MKFSLSQKFHLSVTLHTVIAVMYFCAMYIYVYVRDERNTFDKSRVRYYRVIRITQLYYLLCVYVRIIRYIESELIYFRL